MMELSLSLFIEALVAFHSQSYADALSLTQKAAQAKPESLFFQQAVTFLTNSAEAKGADVYISPEGFEKFIRGGGNLPLYINTSAMLRQRYQEELPKSLLDIGVGDGHALLPALPQPALHLHLDLVEPSAVMLDKLTGELQKLAFSHNGYPMGWQMFIDQAEKSRASQWDIIQMTFSAHTALPEERPKLLEWCASKCKQMLIVEFDVPLFGDMLTPEVIGYYVSKYERGLAEYRQDEIVMQGFLMPVFFGNFSHNSERVTFEQTADDWQRDLRSAGFTAIETYPVFDYWWAPAFMLKGKGTI